MENWKLSEIFNRKPEQWGLRGDPYLWDYLKEKAADMDPVSQDELEQWILSEHLLLSREKMTAEGMTFVEQFALANEDINAGVISENWWLNTGIPLLKARLYGRSCMDEIAMYIAGRDCSNWDKAEWEKAEKEWADYPKDSEEYKKLEFLRRQRERKLAFEEQLQFEEAARIMREMSYIGHYDDLPVGVLSFAQVKYKQNAAIRVVMNRAQVRRGILFSDVIENARKEFSKKLYRDDGSGREISVAEICKRAHMSSKIWNTMIKNNGTKKRDYLFALAIALHMDLETTKKLFISCDLNMDEAHLSKAESDREIFILCHVRKKKPNNFDVDTLNDLIVDWNETTKEDPPFALLEPTKYVEE